MKKMMKQVFVLLTMMVLGSGFFVTTVQAVENNQAKTIELAENGTSIELNGYLVQPKGYNCPETTIQYTITESKSRERQDYNGIKLVTAEKDSASFKDSKMVFNASTAGNTMVEANQKPKITFDMDKFNEPGVYKYIIEAKGDNVPADVTVDTTTRYMYVFIMSNEAGKLYPKYITFRNQDDLEDETKLHNSWTHKYATDDEIDPIDPTKPTDPDPNPDPSDAFIDVKVSNKLVGNMANRNLVMAYQVTSTNQAGVQLMYKRGSEDALKAFGTEGAFQSLADIQLKDNETITIYGLKKQLTVAQTAVAEYTTSYTVNDDQEKVEALQYQVSEDNTDSQVALKFSNERNMKTAPTGVVLDYLPYAIMVGSAFVIFYMKKNKKDEYSAK